MKILLVHTNYQTSAPSGEDIAFANDHLLLQRAGHEVVTYIRHNDAIGASPVSRAGAALSLFWSQSTYRDLATLIEDQRPSVAHFHNTFPLLSVSGYSACRLHRVPVVQTLHNYRLICPGALLLRDGRPCEKCLDGSLYSAVQHRCYRQSRLASGLVAAMLATNRLRGIYLSGVDCYICLTQFARTRFMRAGFPSELLTVRANGIVDPPAAGRGEGNYALYVGRLAQEKGVETLIRAWEGIDYPLKIVGDGPLRGRLEELGRRLRVNATFEGFRPRDEAIAYMQAATVLVVPSEWYEGFPVVVMEAMAAGTPLIVSALGGLDEVIDSPSHGLKFTAGDAIGLRTAVQSLLSDPVAQQAMRLNNRSLFDSTYSPQKAVQALETIYRRLTPSADDAATPARIAALR